MVNALEEMKANGVEVDGWTRKICEKVRRENVGDVGEETWALLARMDKLTVEAVSRSPRKSKRDGGDARNGTWRNRQEDVNESTEDRLELT